MTKLEHLYAYFGQSPWLDNLTRAYLRDGTLTRLVGKGIRGVTANPTIFARSILGSDDYDEQFSALMSVGASVDKAYWELLMSDVGQALTVLRPVFDAGDCVDGFVSVEVSPELAHDAAGTIDAARWLRRRLAPTQSAGEDPGDGRRCDRRRNADRRREQCQRDAAVLPVPLRRDHRGVPVRPGEVHCERR
ncbi:transaldolase family protein [Kribbella sp. NBC_01510]|uniref:transaldolase family protein n=1 Tax=Kribbella sp. NBC_01510 TaxID=2903581 RepID=UPI00386C1B8A